MKGRKNKWNQKNLRKRKQHLEPNPPVGTEIRTDLKVNDVKNKKNRDIPLKPKVNTELYSRRLEQKLRFKKCGKMQSNEKGEGSNIRNAESCSPEIQVVRKSNDWWKICNKITNEKKQTEAESTVGFRSNAKFFEEDAA